jgi:hypothetical protein
MNKLKIKTERGAFNQWARDIRRADNALQKRLDAIDKAGGAKWKLGNVKNGKRKAAKEKS